MRARSLVIFALCVALARTALAQWIGVYFDPATFGRCATIAPQTPVTWYVVAVLGGASMNGIYAAEFRQTGTPAAWSMTAIASPAATFTMGDPLGDGAQIAFDACQTEGWPGHVLLYTVSGMATTLVGCTTLGITGHATPSNPNFPCPVQIICETPVYPRLCVAGFNAYINGGCGEPEGCPVAADRATWGQVKNLFE